MNQPSDIENTKASLLRELNKRRARGGKAPLPTYPKIGCTRCGEWDGHENLIQSRVAYIRTCQTCFLKNDPFRTLRLPAGEVIEWYRCYPTFHRSRDYGIVLTNRALYLLSSLWPIFSRWRRYALSDIQGARFVDSEIFPALKVQLRSRVVSLRTPWDYHEEMDFDRCNLADAAERINAAAKAETADAGRLKRS